MVWRRRRRQLVASELSEEVESGLVEPLQAAAAVSRRTRLAQQWPLVRGWQIEKLRRRRRLYRALEDLAVLKSRARDVDGDWEGVQRARREIATLSAAEERVVNLPAPASALIGRERELADVERLLSSRDHRLLTLTGSGGAGKTRLAMHVAARVADRFASGVYMVELASITDQSIAASEIARVLGVREAGGDALERTKGHLSDKHLLLVLDNLEQLAAAGRLTAALLAGAPRLRVLATSRTLLHISGEHQYDVPTLAPPEPGAERDLESLRGCESVALFVDRARAADPAFQLDRANAPAVAAICTRLDGLPLAIELAASRTRTLAPTEIAERLEGSIDLMASESDDRPRRHQTLRATLDWSYGLLDERNRRLFGELAIFTGGFTLEAAEEVCGAAADRPVLDGVESLVDSSLVQRAGTPDRARFETLQTVREYGLERLGDTPGAHAARRAHARHYVAFAERAAPMLAGPEQLEWARKVGEEIENLRAALAWSLDEDPQLAMRLAAALGRFWERGPLGEGRQWLDAALQSVPEATDGARAAATRIAGRLASLQGDYQGASRLLEEASERYAAQADGAGLTATVAELAWIVLVRGEYGRAQELWEQALSLAREAGDRQTEARALTGLARGLAESGHHARAGQLALEALELRRELGDARNVADSLATLGRVELLAHHDEQARKLLDESLSLARELDDHLREAEALYFLALVALQEGSTQEAVATLGKRLALCRDLGDRLGIAECLDVLGGVAALRHEGLAAARLFGAADGVRRSIGAAPWTAERARREHHEGMACSYLDRVTFEQHKAEAGAMGLGDAVMLAEENAVALAGSA